MEKNKKRRTFCLIPVIFSLVGKVAWALRDAQTIINDDCTSSFIPNENIFLAALIAAVLIWVVSVPMFRKRKKEARHGD